MNDSNLDTFKINYDNYLGIWIEQEEPTSEQWPRSRPEQEAIKAYGDTAQDLNREDLN